MTTIMKTQHDKPPHHHPSQTLQAYWKKAAPMLSSCSSTPQRPSSGRAQLPVKARTGGYDVRNHLQPPLPVIAGKPDCFILDFLCVMLSFPTDMSCVRTPDLSDPKKQDSIHSREIDNDNSSIHSREIEKDYCCSNPGHLPGDVAVEDSEIQEIRCH